MPAPSRRLIASRRPGCDRSDPEGGFLIQVTPPRRKNLPVLSDGYKLTPDHHELFVGGPIIVGPAGWAGEK